MPFIKHLVHTTHRAFMPCNSCFIWSSKVLTWINFIKRKTSLMRLSSGRARISQCWWAGISTLIFQTKAFSALSFSLSAERLLAGEGELVTLDHISETIAFVDTYLQTPWDKDFVNKNLSYFSFWNKTKTAHRLIWGQYWVYSRLSGKYKDLFCSPFLFQKVTVPSRLAASTIC